MLMLAAQRGDVEVIKLLLNAGACVDDVNVVRKIDLSVIINRVNRQSVVTL